MHVHLAFSNFPETSNHAAFSLTHQGIDSTLRKQPLGYRALSRVLKMQKMAQMPECHCSGVAQNGASHAL